MATAIALFFISPKTCLADSSNIFINELMWQGRSPLIADEWVELYNDSDQAVDLSGYYLTDETISPPKILVTIPAAGQSQIAPHGTFLISKNDRDFSYGGKESFLDAVPDIVDSHLVLSNTKLQIGLYNKAENKLDIFGGTDTNGDNLDDNFAPYKPDCLINLEVPATPENLGTYCSLQREDYSRFGNSPDAWISSFAQLNLDQEGLDQNVFATPTLSGRPQISDFILTNQSYKLGFAKSYHFSYSVTDSDNDFSAVVVTAAAGDQTLMQNLSADQSDFSLPASLGCWDLTFSFQDEKILNYKIDVSLKCYSTNNQIKFSEVLSSPKDYDWDGDGLAGSQDEWFELQNLSGVDYALANWVVTKISSNGTTGTAQISSEFSAGGFLVFYYKDTGMSLNNDGETLYLYDPGGELIDQIKIPALDYNISYSKFDDGWKFTKTATPSLENIFLTTEKPALKNTEPINQPPVDVAIKPAVAEVGEQTPDEEIILAVYTTKVTSLPLELPDITIDKLALPEVKGSKTGSVLYPSNLGRLLLYSFSILIFFSLIFLYEFYRRE